jgi:hypothetical protein
LNIIFFFTNVYILNHLLFFFTLFALKEQKYHIHCGRTVCPAEHALYLCCCLRKQIIWHAALSSSHYAMRCWTSESSTYGKQRICRCNSASTHLNVSWLSDFIFYPKPFTNHFSIHSYPQKVVCLSCRTRFISMLLFT